MQKLSIKKRLELKQFDFDFSTKYNEIMQELGTAGFINSRWVEEDAFKYAENQAEKRKQIAKGV